MACRALPEAERADRSQEWLAEVAAISRDQATRSSKLRAVVAVRFGLSLAVHARATRRRGEHRPTRRALRPALLRDNTAFTVLRALAGAVSSESILGSRAGAGGLLGLIVGITTVILGALSAVSGLDGINATSVLSVLVGFFLIAVSIAPGAVARVREALERRSAAVERKEAD